MADDQETPPDLGIVDDLARLGTTVGRLFRYWTIPMDAAPIGQLEKSEKETFRIAALAVIAFLFLTLRPDIEHGIVSLFFGIALSAGMAFLSNALLAYNVRVSEKIVVGGYAFLACTLFIYIIFRGILDPGFLFENSILSGEKICKFFEADTDNTGSCGTFLTVRTAMLTFLFSIVFVVLKSVFLDKNRFSFRSLLSGIMAISAFVLMCVFLDLMPAEIVKVIAQFRNA